MKDTSKYILVTNDDGYNAPGINALYKELAKIANVVVVAPDRERSAIGHGLTFFHPLRVNRSFCDDGTEIYATDGTPTDCVLLGVLELMPKKPDLIVSGINRGPNLGDDVTYSGTVSAAMEGIIQGITSVAVSRASYHDGDYEPAAVYAAKIAKRLLEKKLPEGIFLNVNVPAIAIDEVKGIKITSQGRSIYNQKVLKRQDPRGHDYYWIFGESPIGGKDPGTDYEAVSKNYVSITPLHLSMTCTDFVQELNNLNLFEEI